MAGCIRAGWRCRSCRRAVERVSARIDSLDVTERRFVGFIRNIARLKAGRSVRCRGQNDCSGYRTGTVVCNRRVAFRGGELPAGHDITPRSVHAVFGLSICRRWPGSPVSSWLHCAMLRAHAASSKAAALAEGRRSDQFFSVLRTCRPRVCGFAGPWRSTWRPTPRSCGLPASCAPASSCRTACSTLFSSAELRLVLLHELVFMFAVTTCWWNHSRLW